MEEEGGQNANTTVLFLSSTCICNGTTVTASVTVCVLARFSLFHSAILCSHTIRNLIFLLESV